MSASRAFIDVLVGKLTAYVDASSRPAPSILTPAWRGSLAAIPVAPGVAHRAYEPHPTSSHTPPPSARPWCASVPEMPVEPSTAQQHARRARTPAQRLAIEMLRRLGATSLTAHAGDDDVRTAWRRLLRECHPDVHPHAGEADRVALHARLRAVLRARDILEPRPAAHDVAA